ncbi:MAG: sensor histidine kinase, partial [Allosphingosinicella sp.]
HQWSATNLRRGVTAAGIALWTWNVDDDSFTMDKSGFELWGLPWKQHLCFEDLSARIHPLDRDRVRAAFAASRAVDGAYEADFRILHGDEIRWISSRGKGEDVGMVGRSMFGVFLDVTGRKQAEEGHELLAGEMSHRVKNLLAVAAGLTHMTSRSTSSTEEMALELTQRLTALGRAHDLVRPLPDGQGSAALLGDLLSILLAPYDDLGAFSGRIRVAVERMGVGELSATSLALIIHELATNSLKYGALSSPTGTLDVTTAWKDTSLELCWTERGGPEVEAPPEKNGFGSRLVRRSISQQLGGAIDYDWMRSGLIVKIRLDREKLSS